MTGTGTNEKVLACLKRGIEREDEIAKELEMKKNSVSKALTRLENRGFVRHIGTTTNRYYKLADSRKPLSQVVSQDVPSCVPSPSEAHIPISLSKAEPEAEAQSIKYKEYLHRMQRSWPYKIKDQSKLQQLKQVQLKNNVQLHGGDSECSFRITTEHLELQGIRIWASRHIPLATMLYPSAFAYADALGAKIAEQYGIEIDLTQGYTPEKLTEVEFTDHDTTKRIEGTGKIPLHYGTDSKPDLWTDLSFGLRGWESNDPKVLQKITDFSNDLIDNNAWEQSKATLSLLIQQAKVSDEERKKDREEIHLMAVNQGSHAGMVKELYGLTTDLKPMVHLVMQQNEAKDKRITELENEIKGLAQQSFIGKLKRIFK